MFMGLRSTKKFSFERVRWSQASFFNSNTFEDQKWPRGQSFLKNNSALSPMLNLHYIIIRGVVGVGGGPQTNIKGSWVNQEARQMYVLVSWVRQSYQLSEIYHYKWIPLSVFNVKHYSVLGWHYKSLGTFCNGRSCARPIVILIMMNTKWNY